MDDWMVVYGCSVEVLGWLFSLSNTTPPLLNSSTAFTDILRRLVDSVRLSSFLSASFDLSVALAAVEGSELSFVASFFLSSSISLLTFSSNPSNSRRPLSSHTRQYSTAAFRAPTRTLSVLSASFSRISPSIAASHLLSSPPPAASSHMRRLLSSSHITTYSIQRTRVVALLDVRAASMMAERPRVGEQQRSMARTVSSPLCAITATLTATSFSSAGMTASHSSLNGWPVS